MEETEDKDFYSSLKKKKLQVLCKRYGLSPYRTKSDLANSLYSFFKKKNLSSVSPMESSTIDSVTAVPMEMILASKDSHVKISYGTEKTGKVNDYRAAECDEELGRKAPDLKNIQGCIYPDNDEKDCTLACPDKETPGSQSTPVCIGYCFDHRVDSTSDKCEKNNISSDTEDGEDLAMQFPTRNLFLHDLAPLAGNSPTVLEKTSEKAFTCLEYHVSSGRGINVIVDLNASLSDIRKGLENEVLNCYCVQSSSKFQSLREELAILQNRSKFCVWKTDTEKPMDQTQKAHSIEPDNSFNNSSQFQCEQQHMKASYSPSKESDVVFPVTKFEMGHDNDNSAVSGTCLFAERREHINLDRVVEAEPSINFHPNLSLKEMPAVKMGLKRKRPSSEGNQRLLKRSTRLNKRVLPRKSMRLVRAQRC